MKTLHQPSDLVQYGINTLTGEACAYSMRVLCDLSEDGADLVSCFMGVPYHRGMFPKNWNSMVGDKPSVYSIMLTRSALRELMKFALLSIDRVSLIVESKDGALVGLSPSDEYYAAYVQRAGEHTEVYTIHRHPENLRYNASDRNQHAMTNLQDEPND